VNFVHLHLVLTHFPPVLSIECVVAAAAAQFIRSRRRELVRLTLFLAIATSAMMPAIYFAGVRTADAIGKVEGIQQEAIAPHQQAALIALCVSIATIVIAAVLLIVERRQAGLSFLLRMLVLLLTLGLAATIGWTASRGGAIHHPEASTVR
jgi:NAD/NADP transhydrogenase beta subunit